MTAGEGCQPCRYCTGGEREGLGHGERGGEREGLGHGERGERGRGWTMGRGGGEGERGRSWEGFIGDYEACISAKYCAQMWLTSLLSAGVIL